MLLCTPGIAQRKKLVPYDKAWKVTKDSLFINSINEIIQSINDKDSVVLNKYINNENGIFWLKNLDGNFTIVRKLSFNDSITEDLPKIIADKKIHVTGDIKYDCNLRKWNFSGIIVDTINSHKPLSTLFKNDLMISIRENNSQRIIVSQGYDQSFIFYIGF